MVKASRLPARAIIARTVIVLLVVWVVATGTLLGLARHKANQGLSQLQSARDELTAESLLQGHGRAELEQAARDFSSAHGLAANPVLAPWRVVPIAGHNVSSVRALAGGAERISQIGARTAREGSAVLTQHPSTGAQRLAMLSQVAAIATKAHQDLMSVDPGPSSQLVGLVAHARAQFVDKLDRLRTATVDATSLAAGAGHLLAGPRHYLVLAANNGEMRAGSGMFLSAGVATFSGGSFTMGPMVPTPTINVPAGAVPLPPEYAQLWGWLNPSQTWRNLGTTPRFDVTAPIAAQMWQAVTGQPVDGVLAVDPYGLQALLAAQGPVQTRSQQLDAANVVGYLLLNQYAGIPASVGDQADRLDQLSSVAQATVSALAERPWNSASLVSHLADVGKGRHVLAWSKDPVEERAWKAAGIAGELNPDSLAVSVMNFGGNKLDQFLKVNATLSVQPLAHGATGVHLDLKLHNTAPTGLPGYVSGPNPATPLQEGEYQGVLAVNVPGVGSFADLKGVAPVLVDGPDGPTKVVAGGYFQVPRGQTLDATVEFVLPAGEHSVEVDPSARIPATTWHFRHESVDDNTPRRFSW